MGSMNGCGVGYDNNHEVILFGLCPGGFALSEDLYVDLTGTKTSTKKRG